MHAKLFIQQNIVGAMKVLWKWSKNTGGVSLFFFFFNAGGLF